MSILSVKNGISSFSGATEKGDFNYFSGGTRALGPSDVTGFFSGFDAPDSGYSIYNIYGASGFTITIATNTSELNNILIIMGGTGTTVDENINWATNTNSIFINSGTTVPITPTPTNTSTVTPTQTATPTNTETPTNTPTNTASVTPTNTATVTPTNTITQTPTQTITPTPTTPPVFSHTWSAGGALSTARYGLAGAGTQNAGLAFGGYYGGELSCTEEYC